MTKTLSMNTANNNDNSRADTVSHTAKVEIFEPKGEANRDNAAKAPDDSTNTPAVSQKKLDPTRYGDWEKNGRCIDF